MLNCVPRGDRVTLVQVTQHFLDDPTGRVISFENIALDVQPDETLIGIGTIVLFKQGYIISNPNMHF